MSDVWMREANDESVLELLRYVNGDRAERFGVLVDEVDENGDIDGLKANVVDLYPLDDRYSVEYMGMGKTATVWYVHDKVSGRSYAMMMGIDGMNLFDGPILRGLLSVREVVDVYAYGETFAIVENIEGDLVSDMDDYELEDREYVERMHEILENIYDAGYIGMDLHGDNVKMDEGEIIVIDVGMFVRREDMSFALADVITEFNDSHYLN